VLLLFFQECCVVRAVFTLLQVWGESARAVLLLFV
jgi:hypothetical protein